MVSIVAALVGRLSSSYYHEPSLSTMVFRQEKRPRGGVLSLISHYSLGVLDDKTCHASRMFSAISFFFFLCCL
jgi:hypothetical protein